MEVAKTDETKVSIIMIGSTHHKTDMLHRYLTNDMTILAGSLPMGIDFKVKQLTVNDKNIKLCIYDTSSQLRFKSIINDYIQKRDGVLYIYDMDERNSFDFLKVWMNTSNCRKDLPTLLVAITHDDKMVNLEETSKGIDFAKENNMQYIKVNINKLEEIVSVYESIVKLILENPSVSTVLAESNVEGDSNKEYNRCFIL